MIPKMLYMKLSMQAKCKAVGVFDLVFLNNPPATDNTKVFANFFDGDWFQNLHTEKDPKQEHVIYVQLYEDAMGLVKPFSAHSSDHLSAMFCFSPLFSGKTNSRLGDMDLIAIVNSMYLENAA
jgi:hypothetical protein